MCDVEKSVVADFASHHIEQFVRNQLLACFVVLDRKFLDQFDRIVRRHLHSDRPGGMLGGVRIQQHCENFQPQHLRDQRVDHRLAIRFDDLIRAQTFPFLLFGVDRQVFLARQHLYGRAFEMVVYQFDAVDLVICEHLHQPGG